MGSLSTGIASGGGMNCCTGLTTSNSSVECSGNGNGRVYTDGSGDTDGSGFGCGNISISFGQWYSYGYGDAYCSDLGYDNEKFEGEGD